jgi:hypothetical protein
VAAGREAAALADLASLVEDAPLDEPLLELYLGALLRAGRPAQALAAHDAADRRMHRALGTGPGPTIRALARQARDAVASAGPPTGGRTSSAAPTMRGHGRARLRATVLRMIGRDDLGARWRTLSPGGAAPATRSSSLLPPLFGARTELSRSRRQTVLAWAMTLVTWVGTPWAAPVLLAALAIGGRVASREHLATAATLWAAVALALTTNDFAGAPVAIFAVSLLSTAHVSALLLLSPYR